MQIKNRPYTLAGACLAGLLTLTSSAQAATHITEVAIDAGDNLSSITFDTRKLNVRQLIGVKRVTSYASGNHLILLVMSDSHTPNKHTPPIYSRAAVIDGDDCLLTGFANLGAPNDSVTLVFEKPIINRRGAEIVLFELGGGEIFNIRKKDGSTFSFPTTGFPISLHNSIDVIGVAKGKDIESLETLNSTPYPASDIAANEFRELATAINYPVHALLIDLSDLGYREGESVTSISLGSDKSKADLLGAYAIPAR